MEYTKIFKALYEQKIRYLVCGGLAVNIYGIPRMTADIDILVDFDIENITNFERVMADLDFAPVIPVNLRTFVDEKTRYQAIIEKSLIAYSYYNTRINFLNLDVLMDTPISFQELWRNREERAIEDIKVFIVSLDHLIALKRYANRIQDNHDIDLLSKLSKI
jgi:predicted nucleotidyltransferase